MKKYLFAISTLLFLFSLAKAQLDTRHYIPPLYVADPIKNSNGNCRDHYLVITTPETSSFNVNVSDGTGNPISNYTVQRGTQVSTGVFSISNSNPLRLRLSTVANASHNSVGIVSRSELNQVNTADALEITADLPFYINIRHLSGAQGASLASKGSVALGTNFRAGFNHQNDGHNASVFSNISNFISVMATEDNTKIIFTGFRDGVTWRKADNSGNIAGFGVADSIEVSLDKGESYVIAQEGTHMVDTKRDNYNGTQVVSNKPIAVNSGSWLGSGVPNSRDIGIDQIVPVENAGTDFIIVKGRGDTSNQEDMIVVATEDGTDIFLNGSSTKDTTIQAGQHYRLSPSDYTSEDNIFINTSQPAFVYQTLFGSTSSATNSMNVIPPLNECAGTTELTLADTRQFGSGDINLILKVGSTTTIAENGVIVRTLEPTMANVSATGLLDDWFTFTHTVSTSGTVDVDILSDDIINIGLLGASGAVGGGGYYSGFASTPTIIGDGDLCKDGEVTMKLVNLAGYGTWDWYYNGSLIVDDTDVDSLVVTEAGNYVIVGNYSNCPGASEFSSQFQVSFFDCATPGGIPDDKLWLRADFGPFNDILKSENGDPIDLWFDQSGQGRDFISAPNTVTIDDPVLNENQFNFWPTVTFDPTTGNAEGLFLDGDAAVPKSDTSYTIFTVAKANGSFQSTVVGEYATDGTAIDVIDAEGQPQYANSIDAGTGSQSTEAIIFSATKSDGLTATFTNYQNGALISTATETIGASGVESATSSVGFRYFASPETADEGFDGELAELIIFGRDLTSDELIRINSYLGLKYGITLDQDYVLSNGITVWDQSALTAYHNDVAGIGYDFLSLLLQRQSLSVNDDAVVRMGFDSLAFDNEVNLGTLPDTTSFIVWGNDDGTFDLLKDFCAQANTLMNRTWHLEMSGSVDSVVVQIPDTLGANAIIIQNGTSTFTSNSRVTELEDLGNGFLEAKVVFQDNDYFSFLLVQEAPGGVLDNLKFWVRADKNTNSTTDGASITSWEDRSPGNNDASSTVAPTYINSEAENLNFNPSINFDGSTQYLDVETNGFPSGTDNRSIFIIAKTDDLSAGSKVPFSFGTASSGQANGFEQDGTTLSYFGFGGSDISSTSFWEQDELRLISGTYNGTSGNANLYAEGLLLNSGSVSWSTILDTAFIGRQLGGTDYFDGQIAEVIVYDEELTTEDLQQVQTYLALKYGFQLSHNYINSFGSIIWDITANATYNNNVAGISKDFCSGLNQLQSKSINDGAIVTIGLDSVATSNAARGGVFPTDTSSLVWGHNGASLSPNGEYCNNVGRLMDRIWLVDETSTVGDVTIRIPDTLGVNVLVRKNGSTDFTTGAQTIGMTPVDSFYEATVNFDDGDFFTFAIGEAPGGVAKNIAFWIKADSGGVDWTDVSGNQASVASVNTPILGNGINFNQSILFNGSDQRYDISEANFQSGSDANDRSYYLVAFPNQLSSDQYVFSYGNAATNESQALGTLSSDSSKVNLSSFGANTNSNTGIWQSNRPIVLSFNASGGTPSFYGDGTDLGLNLDQTDSWNTTNVNIGKIGSLTDNSAFWDGEVSEVIVYRGAQNTSERNQIESYLALKYGITLSNDYVDSRSVTIWSLTENSGYNNGIAGIVIDSCSGLFQKQAQAYGDTVFSAALGTYAVYNNQNTNLFTEDTAYLLWGHNTGNITEIDYEKAATDSVFKRLERLWKVNKNRATGNVSAIFDLSGLEVTGDTTSDFNVIIDEDGNGDYSDGTIRTYTADSVLNQVAYFSNVLFNDDEIFTITTSINRKPTAVNDTINIVETIADTSSINSSLDSLLANDFDVDGDTIFVSKVGTVSDPSDTVTMKYGVLDWDTTGNFTYLTDSASVDSLLQGEVVFDTVEYILSDIFNELDTALFVMKITGVNDNPIAVSDTIEITENVTDTSTTASIDSLIQNDSDIDGDLFYVFQLGTETDATQDVITKYGTVDWDTAGAYTYTPTTTAVDTLLAGEIVFDTVQYILSDTVGAKDSALFVIKITGENDDPLAVNDTIRILETTSDTSSITSSLDSLIQNDSDIDGDIIYVSQLETETDPTQNVTTSYGTIDWDTTGAYTYTTNSNALDSLYKGEIIFDTINYVLNDTLNAKDTALFVIQITGVNDLPIAVNDTIEITEDVTDTSTTASIDSLIQNDSDIDGDVIYVSQLGSESDNTQDVTTKYGSIDWDTAGAYTYTPTLSAIDSLMSGEMVFDTVQYVLSDTVGAKDTALFVIKITGVNDPPIAVSDTSSINEGVSSVMGSGNGLINLDSDTDGDDISIIKVGLVTNPSTDASMTYGSLNWDTDGTFTYVLSASATDSLASGEVVFDTIIYILSDGSLTDTALFVAKITGVNDDPDAFIDTLKLVESSSATALNILTNDSDIDGDPISVSEVNGGTSSPVSMTYGSLSWVGSTGVFTYTVNSSSVDSLQLNEIVYDTIRYELSDGQGGTDDTLFVVEITGENDLPLAVNDSLTALESTVSVNTNVLSNDSDPDGDTFSVVQLESSTSAGNVSITYGTVNWSTTGGFTYTLNNLDSLQLNEVIQDTATYIIADENGGRDTALFVITITGENDLPDANVDTLKLTETSTDGNLSVLSNDTDLDLTDVLSVSEVNGGTSSPVSMTYGSLSWVGSTGVFTYTVNSSSVDSLQLNEIVYDTIRYELSDGQGGTDDTLFVVEITGENDLPLAVNDSLTALESTVSVNTNVLSNDSDPDGDTFSVVQLESSTSAGNVSITYGTVNWSTTGGFTYTLNNLDSLQLNEVIQDTATYIIADENGGRDTALFVITITGENDLPDANVDTLKLTETSTDGNLSVLSNDTDLDLTDVLSVSEVNGGTSSPVSMTYGSLSWVGSTGVFTYTVNSSSVDSLQLNEIVYDTIRYELSDGQGGTDDTLFVVEITGENDLPLAVNDSLTALESTVSVNTNVLSNDSDPDGDTFSVVQLESSTSAGNVSITYGTVNWSTTGGFTYTLNNLDSLQLNEVIQDTATYIIADENGGRDTALFVITITGENDLPDANVDTLKLTETSTDGNLSVLSNDTDLDLTDVLSVSEVNGGTSSPVSMTYGSLSWVGSTGVFTYTVNSSSVDSLQLNEIVYDTIRYELSDGQGGTDDTLFVVEITGENDLPLAVNDSLTALESTVSVNTNVLSNDSDPDGDTFSVVQLESSTSAGNVSITYGTVNWSTTGGFTYTLNNLDSLQLNEVIQDTATYIIADENGGRDTALFVITITGENDLPDANVDTLKLTETSTDGNLSVLSNDTDLDLTDVLSVSEVNGGTSSPVSMTYGSLSWVGSTGVFTYTVNSSSVDSLQLNEIVYDTIRYELSDGQGGTDDTLFVVEITGENDLPLAVNDSLTALESTVSVNTNVLSNDSDPDGDTFSVVQLESSTSAGNVSITYGTVNWSTTGGFTYTLNNLDSLQLNEVIQDTATYIIADENGGRDTALFVITITGENDLPDANVDTLKLTETSTDGNLSVLSNDTDLDLTDVLSVSEVNGGTSSPVSMTYGSLSWVGSTGVFTYTVNSSSVDSLQLNEIVYDTIRYELSDGQGGTDDTLFVVEITGENDLPLAVNDSLTALESTVSVNTNVLSNDSDPDGDTFSVVQLESSTSAGNVSITYGTVNWSTTGGFTYTLNNLDSLQLNEVIQDTATYIIADENGGRDTALFVITITGENDLPDANVDTLKLTETSTDGNLSVLSNDTDLDLTDVLSVSEVNGGTSSPVSMTYGSLSWVGSTGVFTYTVNSSSVDSLQLNEIVYDTIRYELSDGQGGTDDTLFVVEITGENDLPLAVNDTLKLLETSPSTGVNGLSNDSDPDGDNITISQLGTETSPSTDVSTTYGTVDWSNTGALNYTINVAATDSLALGEVVYDSIQYILEDENGGRDSAILVVKITGENDNPIAVNDTLDALETSISVNSSAITNDTDVDGDILLVTNAGGFTDASTDLTGTYGSFDWETNGAFTYTVNASAVNSLQAGQIVFDNFNYEISDGNGGTSVAVYTIRITGVNDLPIAVDNQVTLLETTVDSTENILTNDSDPDGDSFTLVKVDDGTSTPVTKTYGSLNWLANGEVTYTVNQSAVDSLRIVESVYDTIQYIIEDANGGQDTANYIVRINGVNDKPIATNDTLLGKETSTIITATAGSNGLVDNDTDVDDTPLTVVQLATETNASNNVNGIYGVFDWSSNGDVSYTVTSSSVDTLSSSEVVFDTLSYIISDGDGGLDTALIVIKINGEKDTVYAPNPLNASQSITLTRDDSWAQGGIATASSCSGISPTSSGGNFVITNSGQITYTASATVTSIPDTVCMISIDVNGNRDSAIFIFPLDNTPDIVVATSNTPGKITQYCGDDSWSTAGPITSMDCSGNTSGTASNEGGNYSINSTTGCINYTVPSITDLTSSDTVCQIICDANGVCDTNYVVFPINNTETDTVYASTPLEPGETGQLCQDTSFVNSFVAEVKTCSGVMAPATSIATAGGGSYDLGEDGCITYTAPTNPTGGTDTICTIICDDLGNCDTNFAVIFPIDTVTEDTLYPVSPLDPEEMATFCPDTNWITASPISVTDCGGNTSGTASTAGGSYTVDANNCITYTAPANPVSSQDEICVVVCDANGVCDTSYIVIPLDTVSDTTYVPSPVDPGQQITVCQDTTWVGASPLTTSDCGGNTSANGTINSSNGSYTIGDDGCVTYTADATPNATSDTLCYVVCDANGVCDTTTIIVPLDTVMNPYVPNPSPVNPGDSTFICIGDNIDTSWVTGPVSSVTDCGGNTSGTANPLGGTYEIVNGCIEYTAPNPVMMSGADTVCTIICDINGVCDTITSVFVLVTSEEDTTYLNPINPEDSVSYCIDTSWVAATTGNADFSSCNTPDQGIAVIDPTTGCVTYTANANPTENSDTVCVVVCDGGTPEVCDTLTFIIPLDTSSIGDTLIAQSPINSGDSIQLCVNTDWVIDGPITATNCNGNTSGSASGAGGAYTVGSDGCVNYTAPDNPSSTQDEICVVICDANGACDTTIILVPIDTTSDTVYYPSPVDLGETVSVCAGGDIVDTSWVTSSPVNVQSCGISGAGGTGTINGLCFDYTAPTNTSGNSSTACIIVCDANGVCDTTHVVFAIDTSSTEFDPITSPLDPGEMISVCPDTSWSSTEVSVEACPGSTLGTASGAGGAYTIGSDGCINYTAPSNPSATNDSICLVICDANGVCDTIDIIIPIDTVSDTLYVLSPQQPGETVGYCVDNSWSTGDPLEVKTCDNIMAPTGTVPSAQGAYSYGIDGCITYTVGSDPTETKDTLCMIICDANGVCDTTIIVVPLDTAAVKYVPNPSPVGPGDTAEICLGNNIDTSWVTAPVTSLTDCSGGTSGVTNTSIAGSYTMIDGCIQYTPPVDLGTGGADTVCTIVCDANGVCDTITSVFVYVTTTPEDLYPEFTINPNETITIPLDTSWVSVTTGEAIIKSCSGDTAGTGDNIGGNFTIDQTTGSVTYTAPPASSIGDDGFEIEQICLTICDGGTPQVCDTINLTIIVSEVNDTINLASVGPEGSTGELCFSYNELSMFIPWATQPVTIDTVAEDSRQNENGGLEVDTISNNCFTYTAPDIDFASADTFRLVVCDVNDVCDTLTFLIDILEFEELEFPKGFSPNGDGVRDTWTILGYQEGETIPGSELDVYNRWGNKILEAAPYKNDWGGENTKSFSVGGVLPEGTYFFILKLKGKVVKSGYVYIRR